MTPRLAPEPRRARCLGLRDMAFGMPGILRRQALEMLDPRQRRLLGQKRAIGLGDGRMRRGAPAVFERLERRALAAADAEQARIAQRRRREGGIERMRLGGMLQRLALVALRFG